MEQKPEPMDKNRIGGIRRRTRGLMSAKSISIEGAGCKSGGCERKAVELTSGDLSLVWDSGLRVEQSALIGRQKNQLELAFADEARSEAPKASEEGTESLRV